MATLDINYYVHGAEPTITRVGDVTRCLQVVLDGATFTWCLSRKTCARLAKELEAICAEEAVSTPAVSDDTEYPF